MILVAAVGAGTLTGFATTIAASFGRSGAIAAADKREGDGATPLGVWPVRAALLRPDRMAPPATRLPWRWLRIADGWSDDAADPAYNRPVSHPHRFSAEQLWRDDHAYDIIIILGHNDSPPRAGLGSAVFLHLARTNFSATAGCVSMTKSAMLRLLRRMGPQTKIIVG